jgi:hypothetical protein
MIVFVLTARHRTRSFSYQTSWRFSNYQFPSSHQHHPRFSLWGNSLQIGQSGFSLYCPITIMFKKSWAHPVTSPIEIGVSFLQSSDSEVNFLPPPGAKVCKRAHSLLTSSLCGLAQQLHDDSHGGGGGVYQLKLKWMTGYPDRFLIVVFSSLQCVMTTAFHILSASPFTHLVLHNLSSWYCFIKYK